VLLRLLPLPELFLVFQCLSLGRDSTHVLSGLVCVRRVILSKYAQILKEFYGF
jgi:hypothetical protein